MRMIGKDEVMVENYGITFLACETIINLLLKVIISHLKSYCFHFTHFMIFNGEGGCYDWIRSWLLI